MFDQLLVQQVVCNYFIDLGDSIELILNLGLDINFIRNIIIKAKKKILEEVKNTIQEMFYE